MIGNGSNILVKDNGVRGIVAKICTNSYEFLDEETIRVDAGMLNVKVSMILVEHSLTGFEFASGIPGTIGGAVKEEGIKLIQRNLSAIENGRIRHDSDIIATSIMQLICDDLKFRDMQNDAQYILLDSKIKDANKKIKTKKKKNKKVTKNKRAGSKFLEKYNDRIVSIRESETKIKEKAKKQSTAKKK